MPDLRPPLAIKRCAGQMPREVVVDFRARQVFVTRQSRIQNFGMVLDVLRDKIETAVGDHQLLAELRIDAAVGLGQHF